MFEEKFAGPESVPHGQWSPTRRALSANKLSPPIRFSMLGCAARAMAKPPTPNPATIPYSGIPGRSAPAASKPAPATMPSRRLQMRIRWASTLSGAIRGDAMIASATTGAIRHEIQAPVMNRMAVASHSTALPTPPRRLSWNSAISMLGIVQRIRLLPGARHGRGSWRADSANQQDPSPIASCPPQAAGTGQQRKSRAFARLLRGEVARTSQRIKYLPSSASDNTVARRWQASSTGWSPRRRRSKGRRCCQRSGAYHRR